MAVKINKVAVSNLNDPGKTTENSNKPPKRKRGRPHGSKDTTKRHVPRTTQRVRPSTATAADLKLLEDKLVATRDLTEEQLGERARNLIPKPPHIDHGPGELTEFGAERMILAYRLGIRGLNEPQIAEQMGLTVEMVKRLLKLTRDKLKLDPKTLDVGYYMGESLAFYQEIRQMALLSASNGKESTSNKLQAMRVAMQAESDKNDFLSKIGIYSPTVKDRVERWLSASDELMLTNIRPPVETVNLAAELGRMLARRAQISKSDDILEA